MLVQKNSATTSSLETTSSNDNSSIEKESKEDLGFKDLFIKIQEIVGEIKSELQKSFECNLDIIKKISLAERHFEQLKKYDPESSKEDAALIHSLELLKMESGECSYEQSRFSGSLDSNCINEGLKELSGFDSSSCLAKKEDVNTVSQESILPEVQSSNCAKALEELGNFSIDDPTISCTEPPPQWIESFYEPPSSEKKTAVDEPTLSASQQVNKTSSFSKKRFHPSPRPNSKTSMLSPKKSKENKRIFFSISTKNNTENWIAKVIDSFSWEKIKKLNKPIKATINQRVQGYSINNYGLKCLKKPIKSSEPIKKSDCSLDEEFKRLEEGIFEFVSSNKNLIPETIKMDSKEEAAFYDSTTECIFSSIEKSVICDFIQVPESIESKNKPNPTVVLTSGCGFGVSTSKTAKIAAETIKFEMDRFVNKLIQKNSETTPAKIIQAQLEAINFAHRILVANRILVSNKEKFGSTELAVANFIDGTLIVTSIGKIKTFVVDKEKKGTFCFELGDPKVQTSGAIGNVPPYKQALNEISCAVLKLKKDSKVVICSKGAYDNLDPLIETSETKASRQIRSKHMAEKLNKLHGLFKEDQGFGAAIETYNQAMAFKKNKEDLQNLGTFSIDKEVSTAEQVIKLKSSRFEANTKWKSLFSDDGNLDGKPGFVTFAIMSHG